MWYDILITIVVLFALFLIIASRITKQTIGDMIRDWMEIAREKKEEGLEPYLG
ncbi:MAG: hypothetical protein M0R17_06120 [Candidatus Omnitrophica bacterium]|jgi:hypothetical protein|nr:hypothetical protein [Candidatus Omnitrophota bacterium]